MSTSSFLDRINWRLLIIHFVACWFFIYAFQTFSFLNNFKFLEAAQLANPDKYLQENKVDVGEISYYLFWTSAAGLIGLLVAIGISITISIKRHWSWIHSILLFFVLFFLRRYDLLGWSYFQKVFQFPVGTFKTIWIDFLVNGFILLIPGLLFFFLKISITFIETGRLKPVQT